MRYKENLVCSFASNCVLAYLVGIKDFSPIDKRLSYTDGTFEYGNIGSSSTVHIGLSVLRFSPCFLDFFGGNMINGRFHSMAYYISQVMKCAEWREGALKVYEIEAENFNKKVEVVEAEYSKDFVNECAKIVYAGKFKFSDYPFI